MDPTAAIAPENILDTLDDLQQRQQAGLAGAAAGMLGPVFDGSDFLRRQWNELVLGFNAARQQDLLRPFGIDQAAHSAARARRHRAWAEPPGRPTLARTRTATTGRSAPVPASS